MRSSFLIKAVAAIAAIWIVAGGFIWWAGKAKATPEGVVRYLEANPMGNLPSEKRDKALQRVADQLNQLTYEERREVRMSKRLDAFFRELSAEEQSRFLDLTLPTGFRQMMDSFNKMTPEKRRRFVERALADMRKNDGQESPENDDPHVRKIIEQGLRSFYSEANADVKLDFAPLIEQMQKNIQGFR